MSDFKKYDKSHDFFFYSSTDDYREGIQEDKAETLTNSYGKETKEINGPSLLSVVNDVIGDYGSLFESSVISSGVTSSHISDSDKVSTSHEHIDMTEMTEDNVDTEDNSTSEDVVNQIPVSHLSSTTDSSDDTTSTSAKIVLPAGVNYERDNEDQKLIAVIGREFDLPLLVAENLNNIYTSSHKEKDHVKFLGYVYKRQDLLLGKIHDANIKRHDLIVMCYNASEARIMLTGEDGFYTKLLQQVYTLLGTNKAVFAIIKYHSLLPIDDDTLIPNALCDRLSIQPELEDCLNNKQVMAWNEQPSVAHIDRLVELAHVTGTPKHHSCNIL